MRSVPSAPEVTGDAAPARPFVGRSAELQLVARHARRRRDEGPGIAVVSGPAGIGRTAFLARVVDGLHEQLALPLAPPSREPFALANELIAALHGRGLAEHVRPCPAGEPPHAAGQRLLSALATAAAAATAVTVVVDDVHLADVESSLALGFAARRLYGQQVQLVLGVRTREDADAEDAAQDPNVRRIMPARGDVLYVRLNGLNVPEIQALGEALGVAPLRRADARQIRGHCEGNPRYVTGLLEEIRRDPHAMGRQPHMLRASTASINDQLDALPEDGRALIRALAVLGERCPLSTAARVAEVAQPPQALEPLLAEGLAEWWPAEPTTPVSIRTPLQREAVYRATPEPVRRELHQRAARLVGTDRALLHRRSASQGQPDPALGRDLAAAAWRWTTEGNLGRAARYLLWAADVTEPGGLRDRRLLFGVSMLQRAAQYEAAAALQDRARACAPSPLRGVVMGRFAMVDGDLDFARDLLEEAVAETERHGGGMAPEHAAVAALGYTWLALLHGWVGDSAKAREAAGRCLAVSPFGRRVDRGTELIYLSTCCELEGPQAAAEQLAGLAHLPPGPNEVDPGDTVLLIQRGHFRLLAGEPAEAVADIEAGMQTGLRAGVTDIHDWAHLWAACAYTVLGSWDRALEHATAALDIVNADSRPHVWTMLALVGYVQAHRGDLPAAAEHAAAAADLAEAFILPAERMLPALATAAVAHASGDPLGAVEALRPFTGPAHGWPAVYRWLLWPTYLDALLDLGRSADAEAGLAAAAGDIARGYRVLTVPHRYLTGRAAEAAGNPDAAHAAYHSAVNSPPGLGWREWRARAATAAQRLDQERASPPAPTDLLTERERAIASLIADGLSNKAVGGQLGITEKTIEAHLTRVYRKLSVKSRGELRVALTPCARSNT